MAILKILNDGYHNNQVICPDILYNLLHSWPSIHTISCKYSHADKSYINFEFSVAIFIFLMEAITKSGDMSTLGIIRYTVDHQYTHCYANIHMYYKVIHFLSFSVAAILKIQNGGHCTSQITCLHFLYDSSNNKLSIHKISCKYSHA